MNPLAVTAIGFADDVGFGRVGERRSWRDVGCGGVESLRWNAAFATACDRFGRLDLLSKCVMVAVEMLGLPALVADEKRADMAIVLGTRFGSLATDMGFLRSIPQPGGPSPTLFAYTLPNIAIAEVAIRHRISGESLCVMAGDDSGGVALWEGLCRVVEGEANGCIVA